MNPLFKPFTPLFVLSVFFLSCDREKEKIPSYIHIDKFSFTTNPVSQGLNTSEIISAKLFVNGAEVGNFELPCTLPVIATGRSYIELFPNVKENASSNTQKYYRVYTYYSDTLDLEAGQIDTLRPKAGYRTNTKFVWMEDFEDQAISLTKSGANSTNDSLIVIPTSTTGVDQPFSGSNYCGFIQMTADSFAVFERSTVSAFTDIPFLGTDVYVEMDIKSNVSFQVGVYAYYNGDITQDPVLVVNPTNNEWKKIYINLKPQIGDMVNGTSLRIFIGFYKEDDDTQDKKVYIDNLKLVHLE